MSGIARTEGSESATGPGEESAGAPNGSAVTTTASGDETGAGTPDEPNANEATGAADASAATDADDVGDAGDVDDADAGDTADAEDATEELFQQSEIAADYVEGLLDVLDLDGDIDELVSNGRPVVEVVGGGLQSLVGQRGATLEAVQELARLAVFRQTGAPSRLLLDIGGYRAGRRNELAAVARNAVERVREHGEPVKLDPMSAFERKCVHDVINATEGVVSESQGEEPSRRIVVRPE